MKILKDWYTNEWKYLRIGLLKDEKMREWMSK